MMKSLAGTAVGIVEAAAAKFRLSMIFLGGFSYLRLLAVAVLLALVWVISWLSCLLWLLLVWVVHWLRSAGWSASLLKFRDIVFR